ncbi:MAG TPA: hypothetical protein VK031_05370 [Tissierellaceae bacterium]|nr:hypothetical protein [Tissierellaceae bacterium]
MRVYTVERLSELIVHELFKNVKVGFLLPFLSFSVYEETEEVDQGALSVRRSYYLTIGKKKYNWEVSIYDTRKEVIDG